MNIEYCLERLKNNKSFCIICDTEAKFVEMVDVIDYLNRDYNVYKYITDEYHYLPISIRYSDKFSRCDVIILTKSVSTFRDIGLNENICLPTLSAYIRKEKIKSLNLV